MSIKFLFLSIAWFALMEVNARDLSLQKTEEADSLLKLSRQAMIEINVDASLEHAFRALSVSGQAGYSAGRTRAYYYVAQALYYSGNYKKALEYLTLAQDEKYAAENPLIMSEICRIRGRVYGSMELNGAAISELKKGLAFIGKIEAKSNREYLTSLAYENLIFCYKKAGEPDSVFHYLQKDRELLKSMDEPAIYRSWMNLYSFLGEYYSQHEAYDSAAYFFSRSLELSEKYNFPYTSNTYLFWGNMEKKRGNAGSALHFYCSAVKNIEETRLESELPELYENIALVYAEKGMADSVKQYREKAMLVENRLAKEKIDASEHALSIILKEEAAKKSGKTRRTIFIITVSFLFCLVSASAYYLFRLKKSRKLMKRQEEETTELKQKLNESFEEVVELAKKNDSTFWVRFREVYPEFVQKLSEKHPGLANSELLLCAMIFLNFTSKEIAQYMFIEHRSVQIRKSRLRKKLGVQPEANLYHYLKSVT